MKIYIKNMACESCKVVVKDALEELKLQPIKVELGEAEVKNDISEAKLKKFESLINKVGLEIVENKSAVIIDQIKVSCVEYINSEKYKNINASDFLSKKLKKDYNHLSTIFSDIELNTITNYINSLRMEKAKEMIVFEEYSFTEIAYKLNYNNLSAFSAAFKKTTGFNPTYFKKLKEKRRYTIQQLNSKNQ